MMPPTRTLAHRYRLLPVLFSAALPGCQLLGDLLGDDFDSGDDSGGWGCCGPYSKCQCFETQTTVDPDPLISTWLYDCGAETSCTMDVTTEGDIQRVFVEVLHTGDPAFSCGPERELECGVWREQFELTGPPFTTTLQVVQTPAEQINGATTLFGVPTIQEITLYLQPFTEDGDPAPCVAGGHLPTHYAELGCRMD